MSLWVIFSGILYLTEYQDDLNEIDEVPVYGCDEDCTMMDRFSNYFASAIYTGIVSACSGCFLFRSTGPPVMV